jgi:hypothetical protein
VKKILLRFGPHGIWTVLVVGAVLFVAHISTLAQYTPPGGGGGGGGCTSAGSQGTVQASGATSGSCQATSITDTGTTVKTTHALSVGSSAPSITPGTGGVLALPEGTDPSAGCPGSGVDCLVADASTHQLLYSFNNSALSALVGGGGAGNSGTFAARPSCTSGISGQVYLATDSQVQSLCNGTSWLDFINGFNRTAPPSAGSLNWVNQGGATGTNANGGLLMTWPSSASDSLRCLMKGSYPTPPYTFTVGIITTYPSIDYFLFGITVSDGTKFIMFGPAYDDFQQSFGFTWRASNWANTTTNSGSAGGTAYPLVQGPVIYVTLNDDNTNFNAYISSNPYDLQRYKILTVSRTSFISSGLNNIGFCADVNNNNFGASALILHWAGI